ncbi:hypothetical protein AVEN_261491-1 [Araneus ventricosus]|uniref:Uncharacterized protein n=1 Tax=Araneus ventricosus TaxID=182803 RepID=A0A4Y2PVS8_ARAVE|nr:hypothetical protein AVEN_261491-1 [Araneus ventricosus]
MVISFRTVQPRPRSDGDVRPALQPSAEAHPPGRMLHRLLHHRGSGQNVEPRSYQILIPLDLTYLEKSMTHRLVIKAASSVGQNDLGAPRCHLT